MKTAIEYLKAKVLQSETLIEKNKYRELARLINSRDYDKFMDWYLIHLSNLEY
jgi:hypothetical protein